VVYGVECQASDESQRDDEVKQPADRVAFAQEIWYGS
jgi:hypothetical protein